MYNSSNFPQPTQAWDFPRRNQFFNRPPGSNPFDISSNWNPPFQSQSNWSTPTPRCHTSSNWSQGQGQGQGLVSRNSSTSCIPKRTERITPPVRPITSHWLPKVSEPTRSFSGSLVPFSIMSDDRYFILAKYLPLDIMVHMKRSKIRDCHLKNGKVHFRKTLLTRVTSLLKSLNPPINIKFHIQEALLPVKFKATIPQTPRAVPSASATVQNQTNNSVTGERRVGGVRCVTAAAAKANAHGRPSLPKSKVTPRRPPRSSQATTTTTTLSRQEEGSGSFKIPGFEILKHLVSPSTLTKSSTGTFYKKFELVLSSSDATRFYAAKNSQKIILRLIQSQKNVGAGESFEEEAGNSMIIESIRFNGQTPSFQEKTKAGHFNVDVTRCMKGGVPTAVEIFAKIGGDKPNDKVVYSISIVRILSADEKLKELRAKLQMIPVNLTKKLVVGCLTEALENGIHTGDSKLPVSLKCPLGKKQMVTPCRGVHCHHFPCFDALNFLQTYEKVNVSKWTCPVCDSHLDYEDLRVDSFFDVIIDCMREDSKNFDVKIDASGNFSVDSTNSASESLAVETIALVEVEDEEDNHWRVQSKNKRAIEEIEVGLKTRKYVQPNLGIKKEAR